MMTEMKIIEEIVNIIFPLFSFNILLQEKERK